MVAALGVTLGRRARCEDRALEPGEVAGKHQARGCVDVYRFEFGAIARRERVERRAMDKIAAAVKRARERAHVAQITANDFDRAILRRRKDDVGIAHERSDRVTRGKQLAQNMGTDESGCARQEDAVAKCHRAVLLPGRYDALRRGSLRDTVPASMEIPDGYHSVPRGKLANVQIYLEMRGKTAAACRPFRSGLAFRTFYRARFATLSRALSSRGRRAAMGWAAAGARRGAAAFPH